MLGNRGSPEARSRLCVMPSLLPQDLCHGRSFSHWLPTVLEKTLVSPLDCKEVQPVHLKGDQSWLFTGNTDVEAETPILWPPNEELTHLNRPWCWERLRTGREGDDRGWDGRMASLTRWTWVWVNFKSWWWTGTPGVLWSMGSQRVGHDWVTELNGTETIGDQAGNKHELRLKCIVTITQWLAARALKTFHLHSCFLAASLGASYFICGTHSPDLDKSWFPISRKY